MEIRDKNEVENVVAYHLSRLSYDGAHVDLPIDDSFPNDHLFAVSVQIPWYADFANFCVCG